MTANPRPAAAIAALLFVVQAVSAHDGPPFPIVSNQIAGPYSISVWTDPDTTDDETAAGQFWITLEGAGGARVVPSGTTASVSIRPLDRAGPERKGTASPIDGNPARQFIALRLDHEGRFAVGVTIEGPLGRAAVDSEVRATYDLRPPPALVVLYVLPFVAIGALWIKVLRRRRGGVPRSRDVT